MIKKDYQTLLTYEQKQKYRAAIRQGYFDDYHGLDWRHTFYGAYLWKYPGRVKVMTRFKALLGRLPQWQDITDDTLRDLYADLATAYAPNSLRTICAEFSALIRENKPTKDVPTETFPTVLKARKVPVQAVYLTRKEIAALEAYEPSKPMYRYVKRMFLIECLTGARKSDCERITLENVIEDGGHKFIRYVSLKSKIEVTVPMDKRLAKYLVPVCPNEPRPANTCAFNRILQQLCHDCGIDERSKVFSAGAEQSGKKYEFVSSHTGRRSFATNLALKGVSLEQIALMMGHMSGNTPNIAMTQHYIVGKMKLDARVIALFE